MARKRKANPEEFFEGKGFVPARLGRYLRKRCALMKTDGHLYRYDPHFGVYTNDADDFLRAKIVRLLGDRWQARHARETLAWLHAQARTRFETPTDIVTVPNGNLCWATEILEPHSSDVESTVRLPVTWNPDASCPAIQRFFAEVLPDDAIELVEEVFGLALHPGNPMRKAVLLLGSGRNGKSVLLQLLRALLGPANFSAVPLRDISENRFAAARLHGKLANICGDLDARTLNRSDTFKVLTGGDPLHADRKYGAPFSFIPIALPIFSANEAPQSVDQSEAWFDRWIIIPMDRRIPEDEVDPDLSAKLTCPAELEGLLVRAVRGLNRLLDRGRFDIPESVRRTGDSYRRHVDTVRDFVTEECELDPDAWVERSKLYGHYTAWAQNGGRPPVTNRTFYQRLRDAYPQLSETTRKGRRGWAGIQLSNRP